VTPVPDILIELPDDPALEQSIRHLAEIALGLAAQTLDSTGSLDAAMETWAEQMALFKVPITESYHRAYQEAQNKLDVQDVSEAELAALASAYWASRQEVLANASGVRRVLGNGGDTEHEVELIGAVEFATAFNSGATAAVHAFDKKRTRRQRRRQPIYKSWVHRSDDRVRLSHREAGGQAVPLGATFNIGGHEIRYPGDPDGHPQEVIGCRCSLRFSVPVETFSLEDGYMTKTGDPTDISLMAGNGGNIYVWPPQQTFTLPTNPPFTTEPVLPPPSLTADVHGKTDFPIAPRRMAWSGKKARDRIFDRCRKADGSVDENCLGDFFLWKIPNKDGQKKGAWQFLFVDIVDGTPKIVPRAVGNGAAGGRGVEVLADATGADKERLQAKVCELYDAIQEAYASYPDCPFDISKSRARTGRTASVDEFDAETLELAILDAPHLSDPEDWELPTQWTGIMMPLDTPSGDGRRIARYSGPLQTRPMPLPLLFQQVTDDGHKHSTRAGTIEAMWYDQTDEGTHIVRGKGTFDLKTEAGQELARRAVAGQPLGISVDLDNVSGEMTEDGSLSVNDWRVAAATAVEIPAFAEAKIEATFALTTDWPLSDKDRAWDGDSAAKSLLAYCDDDTSCADKGHFWVSAAAPNGQKIRKLPYVDVADGKAVAVWKGIVAAAAAIQGARGGVDIPPADVARVKAKIGSWYAKASKQYGEKLTPPWEQANKESALVAAAVTAERSLTMADFMAQPEQQEATGPTALVVDGQRVFGTLAAWGTCHTGFPGMCIEPPKSQSDYSYFHTGAVRLEDEDILLPVGSIVLATDHANNRASAQLAAKHYADSGSCVAVVRAWEDEYGIQVAGVLVDPNDAQRAAELQRAPLSGDWREIRGNLELIAALAVNAPGFPVPRPKASLGTQGEQLSLVAAGVVAPDDATLQERQEKLQAIVRRFRKANLIGRVQT
jgi:hypothetical protein